MLFTMIHVLQAVVVCLFSIIPLFNINRLHATLAGNGTDRLALLAFKRVVQDPQGALSSWNDSFHFCQWEGILCGRRHPERVTVLDVESKGLVGPLPPYVANLSFLQLLTIYNNSFYGEIPPQLDHLFRRLYVLNLNKNNFEGEIPANISHCSKLIYLGVADNNLVGKIPEELIALSRLRTLLIDGNSFTGGLPYFLGNLTSLRKISAAANLFGGNIPDSIGQLKNLSVLGLGSNNLSGMIPPSLYNLSFMVILSLADNQLQGSILPSIGLMLPHLQHLDLSNNQFTGTLPPSLSNCSDMKEFAVSTNHFNGKIAIDFGGLKDIRYILLHTNNFGSGEIDEMDFIGSAVNCSNLEQLDVQVNILSGSLPNYVGNLSIHLDYLNLAENLIYGRLPSTIGNLVSLTALGLHNNQFTETIPSTIGNLRNIQRLSFYNNKFSGTIPDSIGNLSLMIELYMNMNRLEGFIPKSLGNCRSLILLELSENNLSRPIPKQLFRLSALSILLNLSGNHLQGSLPLDIGNLKNLGSLDLSKNELSGEIPSSLGSCTSLENLFLQENIFQGSIPSSMRFLKGISNLNLSHNKLSGKIPDFLVQFSMKYLSLSFNNFEGNVPLRGVFANQSAISVVGNNRLCGGIPELHLHKCAAEESKKRQGRTLVLIIVISVTCTFLFVTMILCILFCWSKKTRKEKSSGPMMKEPFVRVSYAQLLKATDGFSLENLVGRGSFGSVYKGIFDAENLVVAVKVLNLQFQEASKSFMIECEALKNVRHRNLVKIITSCSGVDFQGNDFKALVYDFMPNGSLEQWLHSSRDTQNEQGELQRLNLLQRINIAIDVACALDYLHHHCENRIVHCDLKPSNILLDENMIAHVGDFGLAKVFLPKLANALQNSSIGIRGTIGYAAPEYGMGSEASIMGDVYSYGILLLEMLTGKRPTDPMFDQGLNLHNFAQRSLPDHVMEILDPILIVNNIQELEPEVADTNLQGSRKERYGNIMEECLISLVKIGVACSMELAQDRMDICKVMLELQSLRRILQETLNDA